VTVAGRQSPFAKQRRKVADSRSQRSGSVEKDYDSPAPEHSLATRTRRGMAAGRDSIRDLARLIGITDDDIAERKAFLEFDDSEVDALCRLHGKLGTARTAFVDQFYAHLLAFPATRRLVTDEETLARLKSSQANYFEELTGGRYDAAYVEDRLHVGTSHQRVGLEPKWYLGAYSKYLCTLLPEIMQLLKDRDAAIAACRGLIKVIFLDIELALDTYIHADHAQVTAFKDYAESIVCNMPVGLLVLSPTLEILSANRALGEIFDFAHEEIRGQPIESAIPLPRIGAVAMEVLRDGAPQYDIPVAFSEAGSTRHLEISITPFRGHIAARAPESEPRVLITVNDLTERESLRSQARETEHRTRAIVDNIADAIITIDETGTVYTFNRAAERTFGYSAGEIIGSNVKMLMPEPFRGEHDGYLHRYVNTGETRCIGSGVREVTGQHKDGSHFPMELSISETNFGERRVFIGIVRDTTRRKADEAMTRKLSSAIEQAADSVIITDANGVIEYVNAAFEGMTGYSREEVIGRNPNILKSGIQSSEFYKRLWQTILQGRPFQEVFVNRRKDGSLYYEEKSITALIDDSGTISHFVSTAKDITERMQVKERLNYLAHFDPLTDMPNRSLFMERLQHAVARAARNSSKAGVLYLDLDRFKVINDTLGHDAGDSLLKLVADRLRACVRETDTVSRLGGDEWAVLIENASPLELTAVAEKLLDALAKPLNVATHELFPTASLGVSVYPEDGADGRTLLKHAEVAMYRAKHEGRNSYQFFDPAMTEQAHERLRLESSLRRGLERNEFVLHYQPQIDIHSGDLVGIEALLRWQHPERGLVPPMEFIPLLEDTGLITEVGNWAIDAACRQAAIWHASGLHRAPVAVNLSAKQLQRQDIADFVRSVLKETGLEPSTGPLELELTESLLMEDVHATTAKLRELRQLGVTLSIDDFGTGYSSLAYLKRFPIRTLKIDRAFVRDIAHDPDDAAIVTAVIAMAHNLKLSVIAEGVETEEQLAFLRRHGCDAMQGYLVSRPLPADSLTEFLGRGRPGAPA
jgi:diguanylate cyclase (GGDEF)-like protein/PAS domain S-box-containing protein